MLLLPTFIHGLGLLLAITASFKFNVVAPGDLVQWLLAPAPLYSDPKLFEEYVHPMRRLDVVDYYWQEDDAQLRRVLPLMDKIAVLFKEIGYTNYTWDSDVVAGAYTFSFERPRRVYENDTDDDDKDGKKVTPVQHAAPGCTCLGDSVISPSVDQPQTPSPITASSSTVVVVPRPAPNTATRTLDVDLIISPSVNLLDGLVSTATAISASSPHAATQMSGTASVTQSAPSSQHTSELNLLASLLLIACFTVFCIMYRLRMLDFTCLAETDTAPTTTPVLSCSPSLQVQVAATTADDDKTQCMLVLVGLAYLAQVAKAGFLNAPTHEICNEAHSSSSLTVVANVPSAADFDDRRPSLLFPENVGPCFMEFDDREFLASSSMPRIVELTSNDSDLSASSDEVDGIELPPSESCKHSAPNDEIEIASLESQQAAIEPAIAAPFGVPQPTTLQTILPSQKANHSSPTTRAPRSSVKSRLPVPISKQGKAPMSRRAHEPQVVRETAAGRDPAPASVSRFRFAPSQYQPTVIYATSRLPSIQTPHSYAYIQGPVQSPNQSLTSLRPTHHINHPRAGAWQG
ncbi:unnamed protein product [Mycena citricolor]|uniref:Uncharacterized protein n=1 Tax=Mycena citricolor TaxID=2018698 RepID=A0AAD2K858_9AGAR|nr:unnamed protein product [Mycena citricolor]